MRMKVAVIGGGPAGLRAAEVAAARGAEVTLFEAKPSVGRKLLVAGRGGLNITHGEDPGRFAGRYSGPGQPGDFWQKALAGFSPDDLRAWAAGLGIETFEQRTGRVYPREMKAAPLLRRWVERLKSLGVKFRTKHRWTGLSPGAPHELRFSCDGESRVFPAEAVVLALGGASWPVTGSDGCWTCILENLGIKVAPLVPANCGWETDWSKEFLAVAEGLPLKNIEVRAGGSEAKGELMITAYGLEGGAIYQLGAALRSMREPGIEIDLKPSFSIDELHRKMESARGDLLEGCRERWKLSTAAGALLAEVAPRGSSLETLAELAKACPVRLRQPRPIEEAISSAGGVCWEEIDERLMLRKIPGVFVAGEMIDWEAPTGGYLMQGCFATGGIAGGGAASEAPRLDEGGFASGAGA
jgi:uncharacterized flavoprotein (TIGR03862 family)